MVGLCSLERFENEKSALYIYILEHVWVQPTTHPHTGSLRWWLRRCVIRCAYMSRSVECVQLVWACVYTRRSWIYTNGKERGLVIETDSKRHCFLIEFQCIELQGFYGVFGCVVMIATTMYGWSRLVVIATNYLRGDKNLCSSIKWICICRKKYNF